jgi:hypothetical protein
MNTVIWILVKIETFTTGHGESTDYLVIHDNWFCETEAEAKAFAKRFGKKLNIKPLYLRKT